MNNYKKLNTYLGWLAFAIATIVYLFTVERTASWWDCGEYIATAYKLQVGHPPGAPLFQLVGRVFSLFAFGNTANVAFMINIMSVLSSSFTILFLFWTISILSKKIVEKQGKMTDGKMYAVLGSAFVGSLAYTFSDSFWFSAVEGEVYAMSAFFTALVFWAILRWELVADKRHGYRWIILIAYLIGLSIGVHLLNLLAIPAIAFVYYFKKYKVSTKGVIYTSIISIVILFAIMYIIVPWVVKLAGLFEIFFVNSIGLPFNSGTIIYFILLISLIVWGLHYTIRNKKVILNTILLAIVFILIGYSSFFMLIIRANANTPINENNPSDAISLLSYLNREQYGDWPIVYGQYYNAPVSDFEDGSPIYIKDKKKGKYVITDDRTGFSPVYDPEFSTIFPRMWSNQKTSHINAYKYWGEIKGNPIRVSKPDGSTEILVKPTFGENLKYFFKYQLGHMYLRYFMWNFVGRQNDIQGHGGPQYGNWISGINFIDNYLIGNQDDLPKSMESAGRNAFYFLPFILGLIGLLYQISKNEKNAVIVGLLFIMTGVAIVVYLNQYPYQPRERDYAYAGSFYAFAIWIGIGVLGVYELINKFLKQKSSAIIATVICLLLVPVIMAKDGWDDHDRSGKYIARDIAANYLNSCAPNAVLFTNGDNDTFPLWYAQEVEGIRTDVRVVNYMLAGSDWYVHQLANKIYDSDPLPFTLKPEQYNKGVNQSVPFYKRDIKGYIELKDIIGFIANESDQTKLPLQSGKKINYLPTKKIKLTIDSATVVSNGTVPIELADKIVPVIKWDVRQSSLYKNDLMLLDFIATNNWDRPIYFANPSAVNKVLDVDKFCHMEGFVYRFIPVEAKYKISGMGGVATDRSYDIVMNKCKWGNLKEPGVTVDTESRRNSALPKNIFLRLSQALIEENKNDSAIVVVNKYFEEFPEEKYPFDVFTLPFVDIYYNAKDTAKGNELVRKLLDTYIDNLEYYNSLDDQNFKLYEEDIHQAIAVLQRLSQIAKENKQLTLSKEVDSIFYKQIEYLR